MRNSESVPFSNLRGKQYFRLGSSLYSTLEKVV